MQGSARKNLLMFNKLCGERALERVVLVTTMWEKLMSQDEGARREAELATTERYWGHMSSRGSQIARHANNAQSARKLVEMLVSSTAVEGAHAAAPEPISLAIQEEMVDQEKLLEETTAGEVVCDDFAKEKVRNDRMLEDYRRAAEEAMLQKDTERQHDLQELIAEMERDDARLRRSQEVLAADLQQMVKTRYDQPPSAELEDERARRLSGEYSVRSGISAGADLAARPRQELGRGGLGMDEAMSRPRSLIRPREYQSFRTTQRLSLSLRGRHCSFIGPDYTKS